MSTHSVAEAKNQLPRLIDRALRGEALVITRRGQPVEMANSVPGDISVGRDGGYR